MLCAARVAESEGILKRKSKVSREAFFPREKFYFVLCISVFRKARKPHTVRLFPWLFKTVQ